MRSALIDTNLLVLLVVGTYDRNYISKHKKTKEFCEEDYDLLLKVISVYDRIWITSHCLAETSNLLKLGGDENRTNELLGFLSNLFGEFKESHMRKSLLFNNSSFTRLGVADTGFLIKSEGVTCSFTIDLDLHLEILRTGNKSINFNNLRKFLLPQHDQDQKGNMKGLDFKKCEYFREYEYLLSRF